MIAPAGRLLAFTYHTVVCLAFLLAACAKAQSVAQQDSLPDPFAGARSLVPDEDRRGCVVAPVPEELGFDRFYTKYCAANGIPILSSAAVEDRALRQAYCLVSNMLAPIPEVRQELVKRGAYFAIIGLEEELTMLPEYAHMNSEYWDKRAKGLGGTLRDPVTSAPEENLICFRRDRYYGESITVHEFAHTIHLAGLGADYRRFTAELTALYKAARRQGLWEDTYAGENVEEYWAEGVQSYFNTNIGTNPADGIHNPVNTRQELAQYDPALYAFISDFFHGFEWTPTCPTGK